MTGQLTKKEVIGVIRALSKVKDSSSVQRGATMMHSLSLNFTGQLAILRYDGIPILMDFLRSPLESASLLAVRSLHNLLLQQVSSHLAIRSAGCVEILFTLLKSTDVVLLTFTVSCLLKLIHRNQAIKRIVLTKGRLLTLVNIVQSHTDQQLLLYTCMILRALSVCPSIKEAIIEAGGIRALILHLDHPSQHVVQRSLETLRHLLADNVGKPGIPSAHEDDIEIKTAVPSEMPFKKQEDNVEELIISLVQEEGAGIEVSIQSEMPPKEEEEGTETASLSADLTMENVDERIIPSVQGEGVGIEASVPPKMPLKAKKKGRESAILAAFLAADKVGKVIIPPVQEEGVGTKASISAERPPKKQEERAESAILSAVLAMDNADEVVIHVEQDECAGIKASVPREILPEKQEESTELDMLAMNKMCELIISSVHEKVVGLESSVRPEMSLKEKEEETAAILATLLAMDNVEEVIIPPVKKEGAGIKASVPSAMPPKKQEASKESAVLVTKTPRAAPLSSKGMSRAQLYKEYKKRVYKEYIPTLLQGHEQANMDRRRQSMNRQSRALSELLASTLEGLNSEKNREDLHFKVLYAITEVRGRDISEQRSNKPT